MKKRIALLITWLSMLCSSNVISASVLEPQAAFELKLTAITPQLIQLHWHMAPGYYLRQKQLQFNSTTEGIDFGSPQWPKAEQLPDGSNIYRQALQLEVPIIAPLQLSPKTIDVTVYWQGCPPQPHSCYPQQQQNFNVSLPDSLLPQAASSTLSQESVWAPLFNTSKSLNETTLLEPEQAFQFSLSPDGPQLLTAQWNIAEGYYLYRDKFEFELIGGRLATPQMPTGTIKDDPKFGPVEIYQQHLSISLPIHALEQQAVQLKTTYQGCAEIGVCYPPVQVVTPIEMPQPLPETPEVLSITEEPPPEESAAIAALTELGNQLGLGEDSDDFLDPEIAFVISAHSVDNNIIILKWKIAEGYYLYRDKIKVSLNSPGRLGKPQMPESITKADPLFGEVAIYQQAELEINYPIQTPPDQVTATLQVHYQGCAEGGLCYPPITKELQVALGQSQAIAESDRIAQLLMQENRLYTLALFFGLGLLLSLTPCVFPMIPILSSIIIGQGEQVNAYKALMMSIIYVIAMALTYAIAGVITGLVGENLQAAFQNPWIIGSFALLFVLLSLSMFGFYELQLPQAWQLKLVQLSNRQQGGTLIGVAIMGVLSALIVGPCVAAPLAGALIYIGQTGDALLGGLSLFFMSLGMGAPLILIGVSAGHLLPKSGLWMSNVKAIFGVLLLAVAIWMLERILANQIILLLWASLLIISAVYMGALDQLSAGVSGWRRLWKGLGLIFLLYGIFLMIAVARGQGSLLNPLSSLTPAAPQAPPATAQLPFKPVKGLEAFKEILATVGDKPVMLDFYADWCISCKEMEQFTFTDPGVQQQLAHMVLLKADVTANDEQDKALYQHFGIFGPPAILFFSKQGKELRAYRVIGFMPATTFRQHLERVLAAV